MPIGDAIKTVVIIFLPRTFYLLLPLNLYDT